MSALYWAATGALFVVCAVVLGVIALLALFAELFFHE